MARITRSTLGRFGSRPRWWSLSVALLLAIGAALLLLSPVSGQAKAESPKAAKAASSNTIPRSAHTGGGIAELTKWEYASVPLLVHATKQILDTWGEDGWELVQVVPGPNNPEQLVAYLKRPKFA
jgi:hypothetical protein